MRLAKFAWRKNIPHGCILRRPCLCGDASATALILRPIHMLWPRMIQNVDTRGRFPPSLAASKFNRTLKGAMKRARYQSGEKSPSHCIRRGSTQEMELAGSPMDAIKGAGRWRGMGLKSYIDARVTGALEISRLVAIAANSDSDDDPDSPETPPIDESLRKKLRKFPTRERAN